MENLSVNSLIQSERNRKSFLLGFCVALSVAFLFGVYVVYLAPPRDPHVLKWTACTIGIVVCCTFLPRFFFRNWRPKDAKLRQFVKERIISINATSQSLQTEKTQLEAFLNVANETDVGLEKEDEIPAFLSIPADEEAG